MSDKNYPNRVPPVSYDVDVIVAGGGVSGVAAAIGAARAGAGTLLIEREGLLGGVASTCLMTSMTNHMFTGDGRQVVKGVCEEVLDNLVERGATSPLWRSRAVPAIPFGQESFRTVLMEMLRDAGVDLLLETRVVDAIVTDGLLTGVIVEHEGGREAIQCKVAVDATGDAELAFRCGSPYRHTPPDSGSLLFFMSHVDLDKTVAYFEAHPEEWQQYRDTVTPLEDFFDNWRRRGIFHLPHHGGCDMRLVQDVIERGEYVRELGLCQNLDALGMFAYRSTDEVLINSCTFRIDHLDPRAHSRAEWEARCAVPRIAEFLQKHMPGFEEARVSTSAPKVGVRYTRWIDAGFDLTNLDVAQGARFEDVIGVIGAYDLHPRGGMIHPPYPADLPFRIMLPQNVENLIVGSGKSVSVSPRGLLRLQVHCYVLGQGAGVAAALSAKKGTTAREVGLREVQKALLAQNVYLGEADRLAELGIA